MDLAHTSVEQIRDPLTQHHINVIVEVDGENRHVTFEGSPTTGRELRTKAGAPLTDDLVRLVHGQPKGGNIGLEDAVEIHDGDHFLALPTGKVS